MDVFRYCFMISYGDGGDGNITFILFNNYAVFFLIYIEALVPGLCMCISFCVFVYLVFILQQRTEQEP